MKQTEDQISKLIQAYSNDSLAQESGMVYQVWEDGEITLQKAGELLWQRSLHCIEQGEASEAAPINIFPHHTYGHGYAFVTKQGAHAISIAIKGYCFDAGVFPETKN